MRKSLIIFVLGLGLLVMALVLLQPTTPAGAQNTDCYQMQGGSKWICDNGGEMEFQTGATLDVQSGATFAADDLTVADLLSTADLSVSEQLTVTAGLTSDDLAASDDLTVGDLATIADLAVTEQLTVTDDLTVNDDATFASDIVLTPQTSITVTNGAAFTPTGQLQPITSSGSVTPTITIPSAGKCRTIYNTSNTSILFVDTGNQVLAGDFTMGQYDVLAYCSDGTRAIERYRSNN